MLSEEIKETVKKAYAVPTPKKNMFSVTVDGEESYHIFAFDKNENVITLKSYSPINKTMKNIRVTLYDRDGTAIITYEYFVKYVQDSLTYSLNWDHKNSIDPVIFTARFKIK